MQDKMFEQFKSFAELQEYTVAQYNTIIQQSKKITQLESEISHLKKLVTQTTPLIEGRSDSSPHLITSDEEAIARLELRKLRDSSMGRELTMEEARKVEVYSKLLHQLSNKPKTIVVDTKKISSDQLLNSLNEASDDESK